MKKLLGVFIILALVFGVVSCKKNKNGGDASFKMSRVNFNGARYLALANKEGAKDGETGGFLYSVDENGNLQIMAYEYDCDDSGIASELRRSLTIQITAMIPVGDVYIWLMGCRYQCNDYSGFSDDMADRIRGMVDHSWWSDWGENFLLRRSDGKIYDLNGATGAFPIGNLKYFGGSNVPWVFDNGIPLDGDFSGERLRKLGLISQIGDDVYLASGSYQGGLSKLRINGDNINVINVLPGSEGQPINIAYSVIDNAGHLGTCISYGSNTPHVPAIMASDGTLPAIQGIPVATGWESSYYPEMRCIGGKYFVSINGSYNGTPTIYRVDISGDQATGTAVAEGYFSDDPCELASIRVCVSDEENYSWVNCETLYTFNANTYQLTSSTLPSGWPGYAWFDAEGRYYESNLSNGLTSFTIYDLATMNTETVAVDRSQVPQYNMVTECNYDGGIMAFIESAVRADGSTMTLVTDVTGPERGVTRVQSQTGANNNVVVSTLIPL